MSTKNSTPENKKLSQIEKDKLALAMLRLDALCDPLNDSCGVAAPSKDEVRDYVQTWIRPLLRQIAGGNSASFEKWRLANDLEEARAASKRAASKRVNARDRKAAEFELREIDAHGDALDVNHFESLREARAALERLELSEHVKAGVIERHAAEHNEHRELIATRGDRAALIAGGWIGEVLA